MRKGAKSIPPRKAFHFCAICGQQSRRCACFRARKIPTSALSGGSNLITHLMKLPNQILTLAVVALLSPFAALAAADKPVPAIELGAPFADNAILQREKEVPVWGWSKPGTSVTVEFSGQNGTATAGADGRWMVKLKPLTASAAPAELVVSDSHGKRVALKNVLVGEVWHASGQSNIEWFAGKSLCAGLAQELGGAKDEVPIREFRTGTVSALFDHPIT